MSTPSPTPTPPIRLSIWKRIFDKLSGGPPNQAKLEGLKKKSWFFQYNTTVYVLFLTFALVFATEVVSYLNRLPNPRKLQTFQVTIVRTFENDPHFLVELPDKFLRNMEWPVPISLRSTFSFSIWNPEERERLTGCLATVSGTPLRWTITDRFRIWELDCPEEGIHIGMDKTISYIQKRIDARISLGILFTPFLFLFCLAIYLRERRGNL